MPLPHCFPRTFARVGAAMLLGVGLGASALGAADAAGLVSSGAGQSETGRASVVRVEDAGDAAGGAAARAALTVAPSEPVLEPSQNRYEFAVHVENPGDEAIPAGALTLELRPQRLESTEQLTEPFPDLGTRVADAEVGAVAAEGAQSTTVTVRSEDFPLTAADQPGVYLLRAEFTPDGATAPITGTVPFVWRGAASRQGSQETPDTPADPEAEGASTTAPSAQLGVILPIVLPTSVRTTPTTAQLDESVPKFEALLDVAAKARATVAIDPRIVASIRAYGDNASTQSRDFLKRLENMALPSFLLQFADADPAAQSAIGLTELLEPTSLDYLTRQGSFPDADIEAPETSDASDASDASNDSDASAASDDSDAQPGDGAAAGAEEKAGTEKQANAEEGTVAGAETETQADTDSDTDADSGADTPIAQVPTLEELLAWPQQVRAVAWPAEGQVDSDTISLLHASGVTDYVLSAGNATHEGGPRATLGSDHALIADDALGDSVRAALSADEDTARMAASSTASALIALTAQESNSGLLLAVDRGAIADAEDPAAIVEQLIAPNWVEPTAVQALPEGTASLRSASTLEERRELLRSAANRETDVDEVRVLLQHPEDLTGYQRARLLNLFATRYADTGDDFAAVAEQYAKYDEQLRTGVQVVSAEHTQLVGTSTQVPLQLRNYLPFDAIVSVRVLPISAALSLSEREFDEVVVAADGNARVLVPVRSRVSAGESGLAVEVTDQTGEYVTDSRTLPLTIRSGIERIGLWTLGVLAALLLVFGTVRSIRRRARASSAAEAPASEEDAQSSEAAE